MSVKSTKRYHTFVVSLFIALPCLSIVKAMSVENQQMLHRFLKNDYNPYIRPVKDQSYPLTVNIVMNLYSILSYDEKTGTLSSLIYMHLQWQDELITTGNFSFEDNDRISLPLSLVWSPRIFLYNTATEDLVLRTGESEFHTVFLFSDGSMQHTLIGLAVTKCDANSFYYPRDEHLCSLNFASDEGFDRIILKHAHRANGADTSIMFKSGNWDVDEVTLITPDAISNSILKMSFKISRNSLYPIVNLIIPLVCLCVLNAFVFALPESSGERISYALTMLLALILYLNMLADRLPTTGPISLVNINIVVQFNTSCFVVMMSILSLRLHENEQRNKPIPKSWQIFYRITHSLVCSNYHSKTKISFEEESENQTTVEEFTEDRPTREKVTKDVDLSWRELSIFMNRVFFGTTVLLCFIQAIVFFLYIFRVV